MFSIFPFIKVLNDCSIINNCRLIFLSIQLVLALKLGIFFILHPFVWTRFWHLYRVSPRNPQIAMWPDWSIRLICSYLHNYQPHQPSTTFWCPVELYVLHTPSVSISWPQRLHPSSVNNVWLLWCHCTAVPLQPEVLLLSCWSCCLWDVDVFNAFQDILSVSLLLSGNPNYTVDYNFLLLFLCLWNHLTFSTPKVYSNIF